MIEIGVIQAQTPKQLDLAYQCHHDWFWMAGYIEQQSNGRYVDEFTDRCDYYLAYRKNGTPLSKDTTLGLIRIVRNPPFRTFTEFSLLSEYEYVRDLPGELCCESSALCWHPNAGRKTIPHLYRALRHFGQRYGKEYLFCNLDTRVVDITQRLGLPVHICGETQYYMGSHKTPVMLAKSEIEAQLPVINLRLWEILNQPLDQAVELTGLNHLLVRDASSLSKRLPGFRKAVLGVYRQEMT